MEGYCATCRNERAKPQRKRFTKHREESQHLCHLWPAERYNPDIEIISHSAETDKSLMYASLLAISLANGGGQYLDASPCVA